MGTTNGLIALTSALALCLVGAACGPVEVDPNESVNSRSDELSARHVSRLPNAKVLGGLKLVPANLTDRMVWDNSTNNQGSYWVLRDTGKKYSSQAISAGTGASSWVQGVAGDHLLWHHGGSTELQTVDSVGRVVSSATVAPPATGYQATGLALANPTAHDCYRKSEQNYFIIWDSYEGFAVQLVAEDGYVRRTVVQAKPFAGLAALWFGYGADGYEWILFRDIGGNAWRYRAQLSSGTAPPQYLLHNVRYTAAPSGMQALSMTAKKHPAFMLMRGTAFNDHILFGKWTGGDAKLLAFDWHGNSVKDAFGNDVAWTFSSAGLHATAYAYVPPLCK